MIWDSYMLSEKVASDLVRQIRKGELKAGERLASEQKLAEQYGASRGTIRRALLILQESEMVMTRPGSGSYVVFHGSSLAGPQGWTAVTSVAGMPTTTEVLSTDTVAVPGELVEYCGEEHVFRIVRRRLLDGSPISLEISLIPANERMRTVMEFGLLGGSVSKTLRATGMTTTHGFQDISSRPLGSEYAKILGLDAEKYMIVTQRTGLNGMEQLTEYVESWLSPEHFTFHSAFEE